MTAALELARGLDSLHLPVPSASVEKKILDYVALLQKWNRVYNLTAIREAPAMITHHVLDSLAVLPYIEGTSVLDVGSGGGLPGIPLAIAAPALHVTLLESNHKKSAFLEQARIDLGLSNVDVACARSEAWTAPRAFDVVISRAFADLPEFITRAGHHCATDGVIAAMKGAYPYDELARLPGDYRVERVIDLRVAGMDAARHLVLVRRV